MPAMAEGPGKGAWTSQPSRLRNEILVESMRGQSDKPEHVVQVPHSDTIVPGTQLDEGGQFAEHDFPPNNQQDGRDSSLSPNDQALIDRLGMHKKPMAPEPSTFTVKYLPTRTTGPINQPVPSGSNGFSFMPIKKIQHKSSPKSGETTKQLANLTSLTMPTLPELGKHRSNDITERAAGSVIHPPRTPNIEPRVSDNTTVHGMGELQPLPKKTNNIRLEQKPVDLHHTQAEIATGSTPPVQTSRRAVHGIRKVRTGKKTKKGKKASLSQQPTVPWLPCAETATDLVCESSMVDDAPSARPQDLCKPQTLADVTYSTVETDAQAQHSVQGHQAPTYNHKSVDRSIQDSENSTHEADSYGHLDMPTRVSRKFPGSSTKHVFPETPTTASFTIVEQRHAVGVDQYSRPTVQDQPVLISNRQEFVDSPLDQYVTSEIHVPQAAQSPSVMTAVTQPSQTQTGKKVGQPREAEAVLRGVSGRGGSDRVSKPRRKTRVVSAPSSQIAQGPSMSTTLEDSLKKLKLAMLADSYLIQHEHKTTTERYEKTIVQLQASIAMWEKKYEDSRKGYSKMLDGAKNNQKYLAGLQSDLEKVQKSANNFKKQRTEVWEQMTSEFEQEKKTLRQEFEKTIDKLTISLRKMQKAGDELYLKLVISKLEKKGLKESLSEQKASLQAAEKKRNDLEEKLLSCAQNVQNSPSQLEKRFQTLISKVDSLHPSEKMTAADSIQKLETKACLDVLRDLKARDSLKAEEVKDMLSSVNKRLESGLDSILKSVEFKTSFDAGLQKFVEDQVQHFRVDMTKYEEMAVENRKTHESNVALKEQLEAQQLHSSRLEEQIQTFQQSEADLRARSIQLQRDMNDLKKAHSPDSDVLKPEKGSFYLRGRLKKAEEDLDAAGVEMERHKKLRQCLERDGARYKKCFENAKAHLKKMAAEHRSKMQNAAEMRTCLVKDCEGKINELKRCSEAEVSCLKCDYSEKETECKELSNKLEASADQLSQMKKRLAGLQSSLEDMRKQQLVGETKIKHATQQGLSKSAEVAHLREQLQQTTEKLHAKTGDLINLELHYADTTKKAAYLQDSHGRLQDQSYQQKSTLELVRREADGKIAKLRQDAQNTLQSSQSQLIALQKENHELLSRLQRTCNNEDKLKAEQKAYIDEEHRLQREMAELRAARNANLSQFRSDAATANKKLTEHHKRETEDLSRRLSQAEAAMEKSESDARLSKDQYTAKIASDQKVAALKFLDLDTRYQERIKVLEEALDARPSLDRDQEIQNGVMKKHIFGPNQDVQASKNRRRVSRISESVLEMENRQDSQSVNPTPVVQVEDSQPPDDDSSQFKSLFEDRTETRNFLDDEPDLSLVGQPEIVPKTQNFRVVPFSRSPEPVPETQDVGILSMSQHVFKERLARASQEEKRRRDSSSVEFSSIASEDLIQMQKEAQPISQPMLRGRERSYPKHGSSPKYVSGVSAPSDSDSVAELRSSQSCDRPRSQANTASRMMPPEHNSHRSQSRNDSSVLEKKVLPHHSVYGQASRKFSNSNVDTPELMHPKSSAARQTYSQHDPQDSAETGSRRNVDKAVQDRILKRKGSPHDSEREFGIKKPRNSPQADRSADTAGPRPQVSKSSVAGSRSKAQNGPPYARGVFPSSRLKASITSSSIQPRNSQMASSNDIYSSRQRPSLQLYAASHSQDSAARQTRSKSKKDVGSGDSYIDRFDEELGGRR
ncbi:hypothetical protein PTNB85_08565 [Pyrenophora teres f. teres]|nr:hypothetical protein HRS9139_09190 [Pyrenophora teres f. teres]KAE8827212.1 hypothetical protein PTNB85_08565 [Pyrenophora teres f. teres]